MFELQRRKIPPSFPSEIRTVQQRCWSGPPPHTGEHPALTCLGTPAKRPTPDSARILQNEKSEGILGY